MIKGDKDNSKEAHYYSQRAVELMKEHKVLPTPVNYALWYNYASEKDEKLRKEMNNILMRPLKFDKDTTSYLFDKFLFEEEERDALKQMAGDAKVLLSEILMTMGNVSADTQEYNEQVDKQVEKLSQPIKDPELKAMVDEIIQSATAMQQSSQKLQTKFKESKKEVEQLRQNLATVTTESHKDHLTGVANRKALEVSLDALIEQSIETDTRLSLVMVDIDHFKQFNDTYGHQFGDEVLKIVAKTLTDMVKGKDVVARYGGEEFCIIFPDTNLNNAMIVADNIREAIAARELKHKGTGKDYGQITVSMGVACHRPASDTIPIFFGRADEAMYLSKKPAATG
jgi:diguanylate cyclase